MPMVQIRYLHSEVLLHAIINGPSDAARFMSDKFVEVLIAPDFETGSIKYPESKGKLKGFKN